MSIYSIYFGSYLNLILNGFQSPCISYLFYSTEVCRLSFFLGVPVPLCKSLERTDLRYVLCIHLWHLQNQTLPKRYFLNRDGSALITILHYFSFTLINANSLFSYPQSW